MIKALLVDLDGTLVDSKLANLSSYADALSKLGYQVDSELLILWVGILPWDQMLSKVVPSADASERYEIALLKREIYPQYFNKVSINQALVELLKFSKLTASTALVTSASRVSAVPLLEYLKLIDIFDVIVTSDDCQLGKPHPDPYILAASHIKVLPSECLVFEDSEVGVKSAESFGAKVIRIIW
jgi:beta-phosphoglucomutase